MIRGYPILQENLTNLRLYIRYTTRMDSSSTAPFSKWIFIGQSYCIYRARSAFRRQARRFSQNESFVITRKAVSSLRLGLTRASASINVVFGIRSRNVERNCAPSIITVPRSTTTTKKVSFATNNVLLARPRWHMKDDRNEALYILTWQIAIAHVTSRNHACMRAWTRVVKRTRNLDRVFQRGETVECHFPSLPERRSSLRCVIPRITDQSIKRFRPLNKRWTFGNSLGFPLFHHAFCRDFTCDRSSAILYCVTLMTASKR